MRLSTSRTTVSRSEARNFMTRSTIGIGGRMFGRRDELDECGLFPLGHLRISHHLIKPGAAIERNDGSDQPSRLAAAGVLPLEFDQQGLRAHSVNRCEVFIEGGLVPGGESELVAPSIDIHLDPAAVAG